MGAVIVGVTRTPIWRLLGGFTNVSATDLGSHAPLAYQLWRRGGGTDGAALCGGGQGDALIITVTDDSTS